MRGVGPGTVLGGRYTVRRRLEQLHETERWSADDTTLGRSVSLLCIAGDDHRTPALLDGARRAASVTHGVFVRILDVGSDEGVSYVVEEDLGEARTLAELVTDGGVPGDEVRRITGEVAAALESAGHRGMHHLDLKPDDVLRTPDGDVRLRGLETAAVRAGEDGAESEDAARRDAVGVVALAYAGLTGLWPLGAGGSGLGPAPRVPGGVAAPSEIAAGVPRDLDAICRLTLNDDQGPTSPGDFARQVAPWPSRQVVGRPVTRTAAAARARARSPDAADARAMTGTRPVAADARRHPRAAGRARRGDRRGPRSGRHHATRPRKRPVGRKGAAAVVGAGGASAAAAATASGTGAAAAGAARPVRRRAGPRGRRGDPRHPRSRTRPLTGCTPPPVVSPAATRPDTRAAGLTSPVTTTRPTTSAPRRRARRSAPPPRGPVRPSPVRSAPWANASAAWPSAPSTRCPSSAPTPPRARTRATSRPRPRWCRPSRSPRTSRSWPWPSSSASSCSRWSSASTASPGSARATPHRRRGGPGDPHHDRGPLLGGPVGQRVRDTAPQTAGAPEPLAILKVEAYDPEGDGAENNNLTPKVYDGDKSTGWFSENYRSDTFGGLKKGVGVIVDLGPNKKPQTVELDIPHPSDVEVYVGPDNRLEGATKVGEKTDADGTVTFDVPADVSGQYIVVWFTKLNADDNGKRRAWLDEVVVTG